MKDAYGDESMQNRKADVIIIDGGAAGISVADYAASLGASVVVIERGKNT